VTVDHIPQECRYSSGLADGKLDELCPGAMNEEVYEGLLL
jgi:hypothetical protein